MKPNARYYINPQKRSIRPMRLYVRTIATALFLFLLLCPGSVVQAQSIPKKLWLRVGYSGSTLETTENFQSNGFVFPSFFHSLEQMNGLSLKAGYRVLPVITFGLEGTFISNKFTFHEIYSKASFSTYSVAPFVQLHTPETTRGLFNRFGFYAGISAGGGFTRLNMNARELVRYALGYGPVLRMANHPNILFEPVYGYSTWYGASLNISQYWGVFVTRSFFLNRISSPYFPDNEYKGAATTAGIYLRFLPIKNYYR